MAVGPSPLSPNSADFGLFWSFWRGPHNHKCLTFLWSGVSWESLSLDEICCFRPFLELEVGLSRWLCSNLCLIRINYYGWRASPLSPISAGFGLFWALGRGLFIHKMICVVERDISGDPLSGAICWVRPLAMVKWTLEISLFQYYDSQWLETSSYVLFYC